MLSLIEIQERAKTLGSKYTTDWGIFRRFIADNPLFGFWSGVALGLVVATGLSWVF